MDIHWIGASKRWIGKAGGVSDGCCIANAFHFLFEQLKQASSAQRHYEWCKNKYRSKMPNLGLAC